MIKQGVQMEKRFVTKQIMFDCLISLATDTFFLF